MVKCTKCGAKIPTGMKICPDCGTKLGAETSSSKVKSSPVESGQTPIASQPVKPNPVPGFIAFVILCVVVFGTAYYFGFFDTSDIGKCDPVAGKIACGFCAADMKCSYCSEGSTCSYATPGDTCSTLKCTTGGSTGGSSGTIASQYCNPGYCYSGGQCCPSYSRYYCEGSCYTTSNAANSASNGRCGNNYVIYC